MPHVALQPPTRSERFSTLVSRRSMAPLEQQVARALREASGWLGPRAEPAPVGMTRYQTDLRLRISDRPTLTTFGKAAFVDLGPIEQLDDGWQVEISWRAATLAPLFPVFSGTLSMRDQQVTLAGWYAPPGGELGFLADRAILRVAARATGRWLLGELERAALRG